MNNAAGIIIGIAIGIVIGYVAFHSTSWQTLSSGLTSTYQINSNSNTSISQRSSITTTSTVMTVTIDQILANPSIYLNTTVSVTGQFQNGCNAYNAYPPWYQIVNTNDGKYICVEVSPDLGSWVGKNVDIIGIVLHNGNQVDIKLENIYSS